MSNDRDNLEQRAASLQKEIRTKQKALDEVMREMTDHSALDAFTFQTPDGEVSLESLFGDQDDLIVIHNMGVHCSYCTLWGDGLNGLLPHLENRAAVALCSPDAPDVQAAFAENRGWNFRMVSDTERTFTRAMGYARDVEDEDGGTRTMVMPGFSTFTRDEDGTVRRVAHAPFGPGDAYCAVWHMMPLLEDGVDGWQPKFEYE